MRSRCAVYVDAGYLLASAATRVTGTSLRSGVHVLHDRLITAITDQAELSSGLPLLRVNWYDSGGRPGGTADPIQEQIGLLPRVKLRLGRLSHSGEQKGVDLRIGLDLLMHARYQAVDVMYLVSGDDDLTEAVEEVQGHGIPVILLAVPNADGRPHAVSRHLQREADGLETLHPEAIDSSVIAVRAKPESAPEPVPATQAAADQAPEPVPAATSPDVALRPSPILLAQRRPGHRPGDPVPTARAPSAHLVYSSATGQPGHSDSASEHVVTPELVDEVCASVLSTWLGGASADQLQVLRAGKPLIPGDIDRALLTDLSGRINVYYVEEDTRHLLRDRFWVQLDDAAVNKR